MSPRTLKILELYKTKAERSETVEELAESAISESAIEVLRYNSDIEAAVRDMPL